MAHIKRRTVPGKPQKKARSLRAASIAVAIAGASVLAVSLSRPVGVEREVVHPRPAGLQVFVDPATGEIREAEHDERARLTMPPALKARASVQRLVSAGGVAAALGPEHLSFVVASRNADGTVTLSHGERREGDDEK